jgi:hypothetical protein
VKCNKCHIIYDRFGVRLLIVTKKELGAGDGTGAGHLHPIRVGSIKAVSLRNELRDPSMTFIYLDYLHHLGSGDPIPKALEIKNNSVNILTSFEV